MPHKYKSIIGRAEPIEFIDNSNNIVAVTAKVDTGAYSSSIWASKVGEKDGVLSFILLDKQHASYTGELITTRKYQLVNVENSFGKSEKRYGVMLQVRFCSKKITTFFTLSDRSNKIYPVLIGRKLLKGRFVVDVSIGNPIADEETEENLGFKGLKDRLRIGK